LYSIFCGSKKFLKTENVNDGGPFIVTLVGRLNDLFRLLRQVRIHVLSDQRGGELPVVTNGLSCLAPRF
ncbi:MAG: hypothetical protein MUO68_00435, partial [Desulfobacteraceae bacterium]|nr:hypothetical protein [Desulfobacteraceae bacterium]